VKSPLAHSDYWIELTSTTEPEGPLDLVADPPTVVRIQAVDLRDAQRIRAGIRSDAIAAGRDPDTISVLLDIETLVAPTAFEARIELAQLDAVQPHESSAVTYIGTPSGLAGLIADIAATEVADGVTLRPLELPASLEHIVLDVVPALSDRGLTIGAGRLGDVVDRFGASR
jgi:alkanesulfonate monooxygenase SsuD/methylene tetrahydromethanopterin reductase-like flavin-dependent oxidoreductase (luciferase family)